MRDREGPPVAEPVAAALEYDAATPNGPKVTASGHGALAERIRALAEEAGVPLYEDAHLARLLAQAQIGEEVPPALYQAVAEVITFVWSLDTSQDDT